MYIHVDVGHYVYRLTLIVSYIIMSYIIMSYIIMIIMLFVPLYYYNQHVVSAQPLPERERGRVWGQTKPFRGRLECNYVTLVWNLSCDRKLLTVMWARVPHPLVKHTPRSRKCSFSYLWYITCNSSNTLLYFFVYVHNPPSFRIGRHLALLSCDERVIVVTPCDWSNLIGTPTFQCYATEKPRLSPDPSSLSQEGAGPRLISMLLYIRLISRY